MEEKRVSLGNKKLLPLWILNILLEHSDENHPLTQEDIIRYLDKEYNIAAERKAIGRNIEWLKDEVHRLHYEIETDRRKGSYLIRAFTDGELQYVIDHLLFSKYVSESNSKDLINRLADMGTLDFSKHVKAISGASKLYHIPHSQTFYMIEPLSVAIKENRCVSFIYNTFGTDKKLHPVSEKPFEVNPHRLIVADGKYYLVGEKSDEKELKNFRVDKISNLKILENCVRDVSAIKGDDRLKNFLSSHIFMSEGQPIDVRIKAHKNLMDDLIDAFGDGFDVTQEDNKYVWLNLQSDENDIIKWIMMHGKGAEILSPQYLRSRVRRLLESLSVSYIINDADKYDDEVDYAKKTGELDLFRMKVRGKIENEDFCYLREANFFCTDIVDISFIKKYDNLIKLTLAYNPITDLSPIKYLRNLEILSLRGNASITDYSPIYGLSDLKELYVDEFTLEKIDSKELLKALPDLKIQITEEEFSKSCGIRAECFDYPVNILFDIFGKRYEACGDMKEAERVLNTIINERLGKEERYVLVAFYRDKKSFSEITDTLGMTVEAIKAYHARILYLLRHPECSRQLVKFVKPKED